MGFPLPRQAQPCISVIQSGLKEETHAARWGLLRGYSGTATKWVDFVVIGSTRREPDHLFRVEPFPRPVKSFQGKIRRLLCAERTAPAPFCATPRGRINASKSAT